MAREGDVNFFSRVNIMTMTTPGVYINEVNSFPESPIDEEEPITRKWLQKIFFFLP